jgi:hypothetical protein
MDARGGRPLPALRDTFSTWEKGNRRPHLYRGFNFSAAELMQ